MKTFSPSTASARFGAAAACASALISAVVVAPAGMAVTPGVVPPGPVTGTVLPLQSATRNSCAQKALAFAVSPDKQVFTLTYGDYSIGLAGQSAGDKTEKDCDASVAVAVPAGYQFALSKVDQRGYIKLTKGVKATVKTSVALDRSPYLRAVDETFSGPVDKDFTLTKAVPESSAGWSTCGGESVVAISSAIDMTRSLPTGSGSLHMDSTDLSTGTAMDVRWRKC